MKNLKEYIKESILGDWSTVNADEISEKQQRSEVEKFLNENYNGDFTISQHPNKNDKFEVSSKKRMVVKNSQLEQLTNNLFEFTNIDGVFGCSYCKITSLEGAPKEVGGDFRCNDCKSLKSLEGAPEKVGGDFHCSYCNSLTSLKDAPKKVGEDFYCHDCKSLTSLDGAPKEVRGSFNCRLGGKIFTEEDVKKVSDVKGKIFV